MIDLYSFGTPNGQKASIMLEETGLPYRYNEIHIGRGDQKTQDYLKINPKRAHPRPSSTATAAISLCSSPARS